MRRVRTLLCLCVLLLPVCVVAQDVTNFTQFFINPYTLNPSYAGIEGRSALFAAYRRQWATIAGGPSVSNLSFHSPLPGGLSIGLNFANDVRGLLNTSGAMLTLGYSVNLGQQKFIRFGLSGGGGWNGIDIDQLPDLNDPAVINILNKSFSLLGNAGISVHLKSFHFGASLPNIFSPSIVSTEDFTITEVQPFQNIIFHASNRFYFNNDRNIFEPYVVYRMSLFSTDEEALPGQFEVAGVLHLNHTVWVGASFKQDFGISALAGIKNNFFLVGASYSIANSGENQLNSPTYEIHLGYLFGPKKKDKQVYSFMNSEKEKIKKLPLKTPAQLAAEKRKAEELEKQQAEVKAQQEAAAEQERLMAEAQVRQQREAEEAVLRQRDAERIAAQALAEKAARDKETRRAEEAKAVMEQQQREKEEVVKQAEVKPLPVETSVQKPEVVLPVVVEQPKEEIAVPESKPYEIFSRGTHPRELPMGMYIINGAFSSQTNVQRFTRRLIDQGFDAQYGFLSIKNLWYVYIYKTDDISDARWQRSQFRKLPISKDAWLMIVEE